VNFRLSDQCLIGVIDLVKSIKLPTGPEMTFDEIQHFRVSPIHLSVMVINVADDNTCFILENSYGRISTTGDPIHLMFGSRV